jgi:hypothetical protein
MRGRRIDDAKKRGDGDERAGILIAGKWKDWLFLSANMAIRGKEQRTTDFRMKGTF